MSDFRCPHCGNKQIQVTTETNVQTTGKNYSAGKGCLGFLMFGPLGLLCGSCGKGQQTTTSNTTYWVCPNCGHKFRSPDDLRNEATSKKNTSIAMIVVGIIFAIGSFISMMAIPDAPQDAIGIMLLIPIIVFCIFLIGFGVLKSQANKLTEEANYEETQMNKFASGNNRPFYQNSQVYGNKSVQNNASSASVSVNGWTCQKCGMNNTNSSSVCGNCGSSRPRKVYSAASANEWKCPSCGRINQNYVGTCGCGKRKP